MLSDEDKHIIARWRLVLGKSAENHKISCAGDSACQSVEQVVGYLFADEEKSSGSSGGGNSQSRDRGGSESPSNERHGGTGRSQLTVPEWVDRVSELFPNQAKEVLEKEFVRRRGIEELLRTPKLLERVEPNVELVKTILTHKNLLRPETRVLARKIIDKVVEQLKQKMKVHVEKAINGALRRDRHSPRKVYGSQNYAAPESGQL